MFGHEAGAGSGANGIRKAATTPALPLSSAMTMKRSPLMRSTAFQLACRNAARRTRATAELDMAERRPA
jgi:hypothetical protein